MIDHMLVFADEATARAALAPLGYASQDESGTWHWDGSRVLAPLAIITAEAVWDGETLVSPEQTLPGFWLAIALPALNTTLRDLPGDACRIITDREAANRGEAFYRHIAPSVDPQTLATARVAPVFAGSSYPFSGGNP